jgi:hypothetical protein
VHTNARHRRKFIHSLLENGRVYLEEDKKAHLTFSFFDNILGTSASRSSTINLELLDLPQFDLSHLEEHFTEDEVWEVIKSPLPNKAPSPDGFTMCFFTGNVANHQARIDEGVRCLMAS